MIRWMTLYLVCGLSCLGLGYHDGSVGRGWPGALPAKFRPVKPQFQLKPFYRPPLQSPINIDTKRVTPVLLPDLKFRNLLSGDVLINMTNTGETVRFTIADGSVKRPTVVGGPLAPYGEYEFDNLHVHWGAKDFLGGEHEINKKRFAIEGHCVHFNTKYGTMEKASQFSDGLAVVAFFGQADTSDNPKLDRLINALPRVTLPNSSVTLRASESMGWFADLGTPRKYFTYPGSLTTPPFSENVLWIVYPKPMDISSRQVDAFRNLLSKNNESINENVRPVQKLNGRPVLYAV